MTTTTIASSGSRKIVADSSGVRFVIGDHERPCSWEEFLSAVTKHGWIPSVGLPAARAAFDAADDPEGYGMDEPAEGEVTRS